MYIYAHNRIPSLDASNTLCINPTYPPGLANVLLFPKIVPNLHSTLLGTVKDKDSLYITSVPKELVIFIDLTSKILRHFISPQAIDYIEYVCVTLYLNDRLLEHKLHIALP